MINLAVDQNALRQPKAQHDNNGQGEVAEELVCPNPRLRQDVLVVYPIPQRGVDWPAHQDHQHALGDVQKTLGEVNRVVEVRRLLRVQLIESIAAPLVEVLLCSQHLVRVLRDRLVVAAPISILAHQAI